MKSFLGLLIYLALIIVAIGTWIAPTVFTIIGIKHIF